MSAETKPPIEREHWERIQSIFAEAADLHVEARRSFVEERCGGDAQLAVSVLEMLQADGEGGSLLDEDLGPAIGLLAEETLRSDHLRSLVQRQIGPYRLLRVLGEGGMGIVYLAERTDIGGLVAIKLLRDAWMSPMRRERFLLEQQTLVKLNHPAVARLYDASTMEDGTPWFVMEYADGKPLTEYLAARGGSVAEDLLLFRRVCEAVQYAHSHAIIHRDLKPSNILVTSTGEVKLLDFGIAKQMQPQAGDHERTIAGLRLLTPGYAAPEQHTGGDVGVFTDVYSLGVLLYEILTGRLPDPEAARAGRLPEKPSLLARVAGSGASRLRLSKQQLADLDVLCLTALQPEPERRYRSVDAFLRDITAFVEGRVLEARPNTLGYTLRKFTQRNRLALAAVTAALLLAVGGTVFFTVGLARARNVAVAEAKRTKMIQRFMLDMLGHADSAASPSSDLKVLTLLDRAAQQAASLKEDPASQIELDETLGSMYSGLGKYDQSQQWFMTALETSKQTGLNSKQNTADILTKLAATQSDHGDLTTARKNVEQALSLAASTRLPQEDPTLVQAHFTLGRIEVDSGRYQEAIDQLTPLTHMSVLQTGDRRYDLRDSLSILAVAEQSAHHLEAAEAASERVIHLDEELLGDKHVETAFDITNLASNKLQRGDLRSAEQLYRQALPIIQAWYGPDHPDTAFTFGIFATLLIQQKKIAEAEPLLHKALAIEEKAYGPVHERIAFVLDELGQIAMQKDDPSLALTYFSRAVAIYRSVVGENGARTGYELGNLGAAYLKQNKNVNAEATLRQCVELLQSLPPGNNLIGTARARWGRSLLALKRYSEAEEQMVAARDILSKQRLPPTGSVEAVRADLAFLDHRKKNSRRVAPYQTAMSTRDPLQGAH